MIADRPISKDALFLHDWLQGRVPMNGTERYFNAIVELPVEDQLRLLFLTMLGGEILPAFSDA